jgi:hypothetical protein
MPVDPIIVSYSELSTFRDCPLKHYLGYTMRYTIPPKEGSALHKGSTWHGVMEVWYGAIKAYSDQNGGKAIPEEWEDQFYEITYKELILPMLWDTKRGDWKSETHELIDWMFHGHYKMWKTDRQWKIVAIEHQLLVPLLDERGRKTRYVLKAKLDLLVWDRSTGYLWVVDHKSGKDLPTKMDLEIDDQFGLYTWGMRQVGRKVMGSIHNAARTQRNKSPMALDARMSRTYLNRGERELTNLALDAYRAARAAHPPKSQERARYSNPDPRQCGWKCSFKEPHLLMRQGRDMHEVMTEYGFKIDRTRH